MIEFVNLEQMVPENHLLRQIDAAIDFNRIYDFVGDLYCKDNGRLSIDPVVLFKKHVDSAYLRHSLSAPNAGRSGNEHGIPLVYRLSHQRAGSAFSTVSCKFKHRFNTASVEYIFPWVLKAAADEGYLDAEAVFIDGTHIKTNANLKKQARKAVDRYFDIS